MSPQGSAGSTCINKSGMKNGLVWFSPGDLGDSLQLRLVLQRLSESPGVLSVLVLACNSLQLAVSVDQSLVEGSFQRVIFVNELLGWCRDLTQARRDWKENRSTLKSQSDLFLIIKVNWMKLDLLILIKVRNYVLCRVLPQKHIRVCVWMEHKSKEKTSFCLMEASFCIWTKVIKMLSIPLVKD